jgi:hypothetical protein
LEKRGPVIAILFSQFATIWNQGAYNMVDPNEKPSNGINVQIIVALMGLFGVVITALFSNWDKIFSVRSVEPTVPSTMSATTSPVDEQPPSGAKVSSFVGRWTNENPDSPGITKADFDNRLNRVIVRMWGSCHPTDCDWGTNFTSVKDSDDGVLNIKWDQSFAVSDQRIRLLPDKRLEVVSHVRFTDNSGRPDSESVDYFVKAPFRPSSEKLGRYD